MDRFIRQKQSVSEFPFAEVSSVELCSVLSTQSELDCCKAKLAEFKRKVKKQKRTQVSETLPVLVNTVTVEVQTTESVNPPNKWIMSGSELIEYYETKAQSDDKEIEDLQAKLAEANHWKDKLASSSRIQDGIMEDLNSKLRSHLRTIKHLEHRLGPEVNCVYPRGGRGRGRGQYRQTHRKPKQCICENLILRCEQCGIYTPNSYCSICKIKSAECSDRMYADPEPIE